jgi:hypothetical protein
VSPSTQPRLVRGLEIWMAGTAEELLDARAALKACGRFTVVDKTPPSRIEPGRFRQYLRLSRRVDAPPAGDGAL